MELAQSVWFRNYSLTEINERGQGCMVEHLGIKMIEIGDRHLTGTMPVDHRTKQPDGILHGGASVTLAETLASTAGNLVVDHQTQVCVGLEINANHIRSASDGVVQGRATAVHLGRSTQVWEVKIEQNGKLICMSRMTLAVVPRKSGKSPDKA